MFSKRFLIAALCAYLAISAQAFGRDRSDDRFELSAGVYLVSFDTNTRIGGLGPGGGTTISLENDLGMDSDETELFALGRWYFAKRHSLGISYLDFDRTGEIVLRRDLQIEDTLFTIGLNVDSFLDYNVLAFDYRYAVFATDKLDAGVVLGLSLIDFNVGVASTTVINDNELIKLEEAEGEEYPVPSFGLDLKYEIVPDVYLRGGFGYLDYSASNWEASLLILGAELQYFPWRNVGFSVGYNRVEIEYDEEKNDPFNVDFTYDGLLGRVITRF
ncbi:MAG: hypothetical protein OEN20_11090 [Gammaproteobacteria bacterium]|nr:hypothetical protein [Gammaproteobacteria bacterium]